MDDSESSQRVILGISGSPGICIGKAYVVEREGVDIIKRYFIPEDRIQPEINRFKSAVKKAKDEHAAIIESLNDDLSSQLNILETHMVLFKDKMLYGKTIETIEKEQVNAEWALKKVSLKVKTMFQKLDDPYLQSRVTDIVQVSEQVMRHLVGAQDIKIAEINKRVILVAHDLSPADASQIQLERIKGFVTDRGGRDSHTGIIAKSLAIPSVLGLGNVTQFVANDDIIVVDGSSGMIIINPDEDTLFKYEDRRARYEEYRAGLARESHLPAVTLDGKRLSLMANIELVEEVVSVRDNGADGIGLFRTEFLYLDLKRFPTEEELFEKYKELVELVTPRCVTIRTLDINGDKVLPYSDTIEEANPALGMRAVRFCLSRPEIFMTQIKAILRAAAFGNIKLLIPMISCVEEIIEVKKIIDDAVWALEEEEKIFNSDIPLGIMIEVPSAVIMAEELGHYVDFFSIGTNDLIQYSMAIDRRNRQVSHLNQPLNPAVIRLIRMIMDAAHRTGVKVVMCGEMAGDPVNLPVLMGLGLKELSMNPGSIPVVKQMIRKINSTDTKNLVDEILKMGKVADITDLVKTRYKDILPLGESDEHQ
ncbi:PtsA2 [Desulforapulum autotrophicum HRM2]|uniref:Phosphoenolpyruvate-protein phosphotransferase n=1 Tax=Desulforapulum autotrophicum (strain ATCC 43914 / DSM 3382 / VKM B-1955 / HRM2) TaxID=177437 RepID=C0QBZ2_DESAH|nr:phosphoenolpyruvate--protein phosphotransferase [Desulforapulum autotrophicum]ACN15004.1 PtsA2 [Desulforapulum autotrophicum HRM2]